MLLQDYAQSLGNKLSELYVLLHSGIYNVIAVTETWLRTCDVILDDSGYRIARDDRRTRNFDGNTKLGGGVCLFIRSSIKFKITSVSEHAYGNNIDYICVDC